MRRVILDPLVIKAFFVSIFILRPHDDQGLFCIYVCILDPPMIKAYDQVLNQALATFLKISAVIGTVVQTQVPNS